MALHIIIDGYNLIRQSAVLSPLDAEDIQAGREALIERLVHYRRVKPHKITVVFDGARAPFLSDNRQRIQGIDIRYSRRGELADAVIKRLAAREREKALVVTSDRDIVTYAEAVGAATISSGQFDGHTTQASFQGFEEEADADATDRHHDTRKKGPTRRLPRRERRNLMKYKKL